MKFQKNLALLVTVRILIGQILAMLNGHHGQQLQRYGQMLAAGLQPRYLLLVSHRAFCQLTISQGESSGMATFAHELSHLLGMEIIPEVKSHMLRYDKASATITTIPIVFLLAEHIPALSVCLTAALSMALEDHTHAGKSRLCRVHRWAPFIPCVISIRLV